ncbi:MAG: DUF502 domain-containing protein [Planctomycetota bacterium]
MSDEPTEPKAPSGRFGASIRTRLLSGIVVIVPLGITVLILRFLFLVTAGYLTPVIQHAFGPLPAFYVAAISVVVLLALLYLVGFVATHMVGRRLIGLGEAILLRIPLVKIIYSAAKQAIEVLATPSGAAFKAVVMVEFPRPGLKAMGFITGAITFPDGRRLYKVFIPTTPNPTTGFLQFIPPDEVMETTMSVEEGIKMLVSGGILSPDRLTQRPTVPARPAPIREDLAAK